MISAKEAYVESMLHSVLKKEMDTIEKSIILATESGRTYVVIPLGAKGYTYAVRIAIMKKLENLGYKTEYEPSKPIPVNAPYDQRDFDAYLRVDWGENK